MRHEQRQMIIHCYDRLSDLNDWQAGFIEDLMCKAIEDEDPESPVRYWLTNTQLEKLIETYEEL